MSQTAVIRILHLEDEVLYHEIVKATLRKANFRSEIELVETREEFTSSLTSFTPDIIIADYALPTFSGMEALAIARSTLPEVPFIFLSGALGEENAIEMLRLGATDYVLKDRLVRLVPAIQRALREAETERERTRAEEALRESESRFRELFARLNDIVIVYLLDDDRIPGKIVEVNPRAAEMLGYPPEELTGMERLSLSPPENHGRILAAIREAKEKTTARYESSFITRDGRILPCEVIAHTFVLRGRTVVLAQARDMSELKRSSEQLRAFAARLQTIREDERSAIAREIHDELGQMLTVLRMELGSLETVLKRDAPSLLAKTKSMTSLITDSINSVRRIATELRPPFLDDLGLSAAIEWQAERFGEQSGIRCDYLPPTSELRLDISRTTALFRICQEALTNVMRHAGASHVHIALTHEQDAVVLSIHDNGRGIAPEDVGAMKSLGLLGMRERASIFGGTVEITGRPGRGSTVTARIPLPRPSGDEL